MEVALIGKNKLKFVQGTFAGPDSTSPTLQAQWDRCDNMVLARIMHATIKNVSNSIMFPSTSHDAWVEREQVYGQEDAHEFLRFREIYVQFLRTMSLLLIIPLKLKSCGINMMQLP